MYIVLDYMEDIIYRVIHWWWYLFTDVFIFLKLFSFEDFKGNNSDENVLCRCILIENECIGKRILFVLFIVPFFD